MEKETKFVDLINEEVLEEKRIAIHIMNTFKKLQPYVTSQNVDKALYLLSAKDMNLALILKGFKDSTEKLIEYVKSHKKEINQITGE